MHNKSGKPNASLDSTPKIPEARWVSISNGTREPDQLEDFAAEYFRSQNLITINEDFRLFQSDFDFWCKELQVTSDSQKKLITQVVKDKYQQVLLEAVMGVISLSNTSHWSNDKINEVLSQSTLTAVVTARSHIYDSIKRELYAKFRRKSDS